jgi:catechol-2,3-dioxygenase
LQRDFLRSVLCRLARIADMPHGSLQQTYNSAKNIMYPFGHIDLRARELEAVYPFYSKILPELGFRNEWRGEGSFSFQAEGELPKVSWFGVIEDHSHVPNATRLAFAVEDREEVDRLAEIARSAGAINIEGPEDMPYSRVYYAVYFEDPSGNRLEIYYGEK